MCVAKHDENYVLGLKKCLRLDGHEKQVNSEKYQIALYQVYTWIEAESIPEPWRLQPQLFHAV